MFAQSFSFANGGSYGVYGVFGDDNEHWRFVSADDVVLRLFRLGFSWKYGVFVDACLGCRFFCPREEADGLYSNGFSLVLGAFSGWLTIRRLSANVRDGIGQKFSSLAARRIHSALAFVF